jgi:hypothetical protein
VSTVLFLVLVFAGFVLTLAGGIIGLVQAFQESTTWGLLYWFVPFASLVFLIKFWKQRAWLRKSLYMSLAGIAALIAGALTGPMLISRQYAGIETQAMNLEGGDLSVVTQDGTSATYSATASSSPFRDAVNLATKAANQTQTAKSKADWQAVAATWQNSISLLGAVPASDTNYGTAQTKIADYSKNLAYAQNNAK